MNAQIYVPHLVKVILYNVSQVQNGDLKYHEERLAGIIMRSYLAALPLLLNTISIS